MESSKASRVIGDHGWWPYLLPYFGFILSAELSGRVPDDWSPAMLVLRPSIPAGLIFYFWRQGRYPELRGFAAYAQGIGLDVLVGLGLTVVWMAPLLLGVDLLLASVLGDWIGPPAAGTGFDPNQLGEGVAAALALRLVGFAMVTPIFEELFIRSFLMRYAEVFDSNRDFRSVAIAHYTRKSFWVTTLVFAAAHLPWEWVVAVPWVVLSSLWFYHRRHIASVIVVHAVTNAAILFFVAAMGGELTIGDRVLDLWIFL